MDLCAISGGPILMGGGGPVLMSNLVPGGSNFDNNLVPGVHF